MSRIDVARLGIVLACAIVAACAGAESEPPPDAPSPVTVPAAVPPDPFVLDAGENPVDPTADGDGRPVVLVFGRSDCPISNRYAPVIRDLADTYGPRGVRFWVVFSDPAETRASIEAHLDEFDFGVPYLRDVDQDLVRWTGVRVTPEAVIFVPGTGVVYRGRIDDRYVAFGQSRPDARRHDVAEVLDRVLTGDPPPFRATTAVGCAIPLS